MDLSVRVQNITHITPAMLLHAPYEAWVVLALLCWVYQRCRAAGSARPTFIGHNAAAFDRLFVGRLAAYYGCVLPPSWALVDTLRVAKQWGVQHQGSASLAVSYRVLSRGAVVEVALRQCSQDLGHRIGPECSTCVGMSWVGWEGAASTGSTHQEVELKLPVWVVLGRRLDFAPWSC